MKKVGGQALVLSESYLQLFVAILIQNQTVFDQFKGRLTVEHFSEEHYRLIYRVVLDHCQSSYDLPSGEMLRAGVESFLSQYTQVISDEGIENVFVFLDYAFDPTRFHDSPVTDKKLQDFAFKVGQRLLINYEQFSLKTEIDRELDVTDFRFILKLSQEKLDAIEYIKQNNRTSLTFGANWDLTIARQTRTTGIGFLDKYLNGGYAVGEVYGILAPYSSCKTTLAVQLWCLAAQQAQEELLREDTDGRVGLSVLVSYEAPIAELRRRALSYAARVSKDSLDRMASIGISMLGDDYENPLDYEKQIFVQEISDGLFLPEKPRVESIIPYLNQHTLCLDFSGSDSENPGAGYGGVDEIVQRIQLELRQREIESGNIHYVKNVIIDYISPLVDNFYQDSQKNPDVYRLATKEVAEKICKQNFKCHGWIFGQLSGSANAARNPARPQYHTEAKNCKSLAENMDFCFTIGAVQPDNQLTSISCTKTRHSKRLPNTVLQVNGEFNLVSAPDNFYIDSVGNIVDKSTAALAGNDINQYVELGFGDESL